jgi:HSP20 family molecular chaperone IbpA
MRKTPICSSRRKNRGYDEQPQPQGRLKMNIKDASHKNILLMTSLMGVPACQKRDGERDWFPAVDLLETREEYVFEVDLPGLKPEEIQFDVDSAEISISGKRLARSEGPKVLRIERPSGAFVRHLPLPPNTTGEVLGSFCDGVLELRLPKADADTEPNQARAVHAKTQEVAL